MLPIGNAAGNPGPFNYTASGVFGGGTAGVNMQAGNLLAGIEGDLGFMNLAGAGVIPSSNVGFHQDATIKGGVYGDLTGRLGVAFGQMAIYGKGGVAFYTGQAAQVTTFPGYSPTGTGTFTGWAYGGGVEKKLSPTMSVKLEYMHFNFGTQQGNQTSLTDPPIGHVYKNWTTLTADSLKVGVNWALAP